MRTSNNAPFLIDPRDPNYNKIPSPFNDSYFEEEYDEKKDDEDNNEYNEEVANYKYREIDSMEIKRDAWGNPYSVGEKMLEDYLNRSNKDDDY